MLIHLYIPLIAFFISLLTFFSGFGLGTVLTPVFAAWYPLDLAVTLTAIVHLSSNLFKFALLRKHIHWNTVFRFGVPAVIASLGGAWLLNLLSDLPPIATYQISGHDFYVGYLKLLMSILIIFFMLMEVVPSLKSWTVDPKFLSLGGVMSGFFGGLTGFQGALRSAFLIRLDLSKESFLATGVMIACLVDLARISVYIEHFAHEGIKENQTLLALSILAAFSGNYFGNRILEKVTLDFVQTVVACALLLFALCLGAGLV